jgi:NAD(P)-dependent dehydrogenase (short-subunit alcohol dehydrogenase family)
MSPRSHEKKMRILVSGGAGGVGLACAEALAGEGVELILCDTDGFALTDAARRLNAFARYCDAIEENSVAIFAAEIAEKFSSIDVLINAAGRGYVRAVAMMRMARAFMPLLRRASGRRMLINVAPAGGFVSSDGMFPHGSSVGAFERLSDALAEQVRGTSIDVATIVPRLLSARLGTTKVAGQLYQLTRVDEADTAARVASLVRGRDTIANPLLAPGHMRRS